MGLKAASVTDDKGLAVLGKMHRVLTECLADADMLGQRILAAKLAEVLDTLEAVARR